MISPQVGEKLSLYLEQETVLSSTEYLTMLILKQEKQVWVLCHDGCTVTDLVTFDLSDRSLIESTLPMRIFSENYLHLSSRSELLTLIGDPDCDLGSGVERLCYIFVDGSYIIYDIQGENIYRTIYRNVFD